MPDSLFPLDKFSPRGLPSSQAQKLLPCHLAGCQSCPDKSKPRQWADARLGQASSCPHVGNLYHLLRGMRLRGRDPTQHRIISLLFVLSDLPYLLPSETYWWRQYISNSRKMVQSFELKNLKASLTLLKARIKPRGGWWNAREQPVGWWMLKLKLRLQYFGHLKILSLLIIMANLSWES